MRVLVTGFRHWKDRASIEAAILDCFPSVVIEGGQRTVYADGSRAGADWHASEVAKQHSIPLRTICAEWELFGREAGPLRNKRMLDEEKPNIVLAFIEIGCIGTMDMVNQTNFARVELRKFYGPEILKARATAARPRGRKKWWMPGDNDADVRRVRKTRGTAKPDAGDDVL